jgi:hypothetical protein
MIWARAVIQSSRMDESHCFFYREDLTAESPLPLYSKSGAAIIYLRDKWVFSELWKAAVSAFLDRPRSSRACS